MGVGRGEQVFLFHETFLFLPVYPTSKQIFSKQDPPPCIFIFNFANNHYVTLIISCEGWLPEQVVS